MNVVKLVVLGAGGVGKSSLTVQFVSGVFLNQYDPTIEDSYRRQIGLECRQYMLEILDTAGTEQFTAMRDLYMKDGEGFVLVYSITSGPTFEEVAAIAQQLLRVKGSEDVAFMLVGNKCDLESMREVSTEQGQQLAMGFKNCAFLEASAKTNENVHALFEQAARLVVKQKGVSGGSGGGSMKNCRRKSVLNVEESMKSWDRGGRRRKRKESCVLF